MGDAQRLALWIRGELGELTHLKLQKLCFYCYGGTLAFDLGNDVGAVRFEPWEHGPVSREVWQEYREHGRTPIPAPATPVDPYQSGTTAALRDVLEVYGHIDAWGLRQESHREDPWRVAWESGLPEIPQSHLRTHFKQKFASGAIAAPAHLLPRSSFAIDGVPLQPFDSLHALAEALRKARRNVHTATRT